ncbi:MAG TPA: hypothetical protein VNA69_03375 [Thermoanaerobaculia bacterium]|nr:hypothetical protein [Thermoanaerobaculia bacterium]
MTETYRKRGTVVRWENGTLVRVTENGVAIEDGNFFSCEPERRLPAGRSADILSAAVQQRARTIISMIEPPITIERLVLSHGIAEHDFNGRTWSDEAQRLHLSLIHKNIRALVDSIDDIPRVADALARCDGERDAPARLRLAPCVTAALVPSLIGLAPPNIELWQTAGGIDGKGNAIEAVRIEREPWPNWYRPSYRVRPIRMPLDVRIRCEVIAIERDRPLAVALLAPIDGLTLRVLVDDGERAWPATVRVTRIDAVADEAVWYPYGGGSFGAEMML